MNAFLKGPAFDNRNQTHQSDKTSFFIAGNVTGESDTGFVGFKPVYCFAICEHMVVILYSTIIAATSRDI